MPTSMPSDGPSASPSDWPSAAPSSEPTAVPSAQPSAQPAAWPAASCLNDDHDFLSLSLTLENLNQIQTCLVICKETNEK